MNKQIQNLKRISISGIIYIFLVGNLSAQTPANSLLWKISGNGLENPSYLYGTIHIYDTATFKIPTLVYDHIKEVDAFAMEINPADVNQMDVAQRMMIPDDNTLDKLLGEEAFAKIMEYPMPAMMGSEVIKRIKPFFIASMLYTDDPSQPMLSVDGDLYMYALAQGKRAIGIETMTEQLDVIDGISMEEQVALLKESLEKYEDAKDGLIQLMLAYKSQSFEQLTKELHDSNPSPLFSDLMLTKRNILMADRITSYMQEGITLFSAIGALHLCDISAETKGVVTLLQEKGYTVTPITVSFD